MKLTRVDKICNVEPSQTEDKPKTNTKEVQGKRGPIADRIDVKEDVLQAARFEFASKGYQRATMRGIAKRANVDPKLIHYYFGSKSKLFTKLIADAYEEHHIVDRLHAFFIDGSLNGEEYIKLVLHAMETSNFGPAVLSVLRGFSEHEESRDVFQGFIYEQILPKLRADTNDPMFDIKVSLIGSQMFGLVVARYLVKVPALTAMSIEEIAKDVGPVLDHYRNMR